MRDYYFIIFVLQISFKKGKHTWTYVLLAHKL